MNFVLTQIIWAILISLVFAGFLTIYVLRKDSGSKKMRQISDAIKEGAEAFMKRQYRTIAIICIIFAIAIFAIYFFTGNVSLGFKTAIAFILGALSSGIAGYISMWISIRTNSRTANAAKKSINESLKTAFYGGAVAGIVIIALSVLGIVVLFYAFNGLNVPKEIPFLIVGYGFGASFVALFAQLVGGIYTKAADVGADLVGKVEAGIPEDDPRNPAVIADLVGDNVGDCAGRGADIFESTAAENIAAMIIGVVLFPYFGINGILFPLFVAVAGLLATIIGLFFVWTNEKSNPMSGLIRGYAVTSILVTIAFFYLTKNLLYTTQAPGAWLWFFYAGLVGILASILFVVITIYYTDSSFKPVQSIARASKTGHATNIIQGFAIGLECTALPIIVLAVSLALSFVFGMWSGIPNGGIYGIASATIGMLATAAYILAMDNFGPITDNAGGINEMSGASERVRRRTDKLDAAGNTTKALTKGYALGSAGLAAFLLFSAFTQEVVKLTGSEFSVNLAKLPVFIGAMLGAMLIFLFASLAIRAVGEAAYDVVNEVRRQFKENPGIMKGTKKPDYAKCVDICAVSALKKMVAPGLLVVAMTLIVGLVLKVEAVGAYILVATIVGILLALLMNTGGGAWDNAKKYIESGQYGGKGSEAHKAAVTGDTLGDPFKDTAGPSLHVLIKLIGTITLVLLPLFV